MFKISFVFGIPTSSAGQLPILGWLNHRCSVCSRQAEGVSLPYQDALPPVLQVPGGARDAVVWSGADLLRSGWISLKQFFFSRTNSYFGVVSFFFLWRDSLVKVQTF